ncbi:MAG: aminoacyl-tRNA hydrolase [Thermostichales cyanobacterium BF4_bins_65]
MTAIRLIVGLGNPGPQYQHSRHNCGFMVLDRLSQRWGIPLQHESRFQGLVGEGLFQTHKLRLLQPQTYMNRSGQSVQAILAWYKWDPEQMLVIYDDIDLPLGRLRLRQRGSAGGHNGIKSLIEHVGTDVFPRLRVGVGHPGGKKAVVQHVLGAFSPEEQGCANRVLDTVVEAVELILEQDLAAAMNRYNGLDCCAQPASELSA